jgi:hypothetical protein
MRQVKLQNKLTKVTRPASDQEKSKMNGSSEPPKGKPTANLAATPGKKGIQTFNTITEYSKNPEGKVSNTYMDVERGKASSYKIKHPEETSRRTTDGYLVKKTKAYTLPMKEMKSNISNQLKPNTSSTPAAKTNIASKISAALKRAKKG